VKKVIVIGEERCESCKLVVEYLKKKGIPYEVRIPNKMYLIYYVNMCGGIPVVLFIGRLGEIADYVCGADFEKLEEKIKKHFKYF